MALRSPQQVRVHWDWTLVGYGLVWLLLLAWFVILGVTQAGHLPASSPDEAANHLFSQSLASSGTLHVPTRLTVEQNAIFHARSVAPQETALVPGSFLGFTLMSSLWLRLGFYGPYVASSIMALVAVWAVYRIGRRYWERPWAMIAAVSVATFPGYIAFVSLPYHQAGLYTSVLVVAGLCMLRFEEQPTYRRAAVLGLLYGLAISIRPVEVLWTGPIIAVLQCVKPQGWKKLLVTMITTLLVQVPWLVAGVQVYGSILGSGYTVHGLTLSTDVSANGRSLWALFVPPGGSWSWSAWSHFMTTTAWLFPVTSAMAAIALVKYFRRKFVGIRKVTKIGAVVIFVGIYIMYYGSENIAPNTPARVSFLSSYVRYWLPLLVAMSIGAVVFLRLVIRRWRYVVPIIAAIWVLNGWQLWSHESAGLSAQVRRDLRFRTIQAQVRTQTGTDGFLFAGQLDKVIVGLRDTSFRIPETTTEWQVLADMSHQRPVYMLASAWPSSYAEVQQSAAAVGVSVVTVGRVDGEGLWQFRP